MYLKQINVGGFQLGGDTGCCPDDSNPVCRFEFVITDMTDLTSITIDGNTHTLEVGSADAGDLALAIQSAFEDEGYFSSGYPTVNIYQNTFSSETVILIYANAETVTMVTVPVADINGTQDCIELVTCRYEITVDVGALDIDLSDPDVEAANPGDSPQNVADTYATGAGDTLAQDVWDAIVALYASETNYIPQRVKVTEDIVAATFKINVWLFGHRDLSAILSGETENIAVKCECKKDFTELND